MQETFGERSEVLRREGGESRGAWNVFSVDVEDYFQVRSFANRIPLSSWGSYETRFEGATRKLLELLGEYEVRGTFFVLGWNAKKAPSLVKEIMRAGHEVASHGWSHTLIYDQTREEFRDEVRDTKSLLEDITGTRVVGFRAPSYSVTERSLWALDVLAESGHLYDASIYPVRRRVYGIPSERSVPHLRAVAGGKIAEFPMSAARFGPWNLPFGSGAYFRFMPLPITRLLIGRFQRMGLPAVISVHPWELDPGQPKICSVFAKPNHYLFLGRTLPRLKRVLREFRFLPMKEALEELSLLPRTDSQARAQNRV